MIPILINKDVFELSYNDLKFIVWNHNYFCTNLIITYKELNAASNHVSLKLDPSSFESWDENSVLVNTLISVLQSTQISHDQNSHAQKLRNNRCMLF